MRIVVFAVTVAHLFAHALIADDEFSLELREIVSESDPGAVVMELANREETETIYVGADTIVDADDVESVQVLQSEDVKLNVTLKKTVHAKLLNATQRLRNKRIAVIADGKLWSAPVVREPFSKGSIIAGNFTREWAENFVAEVGEKN